MFQDKTLPAGLALLGLALFVFLAARAAWQWRAARRGRPDPWRDDLRSGRCAAVPVNGRESQSAQGWRHLWWILTRSHGVNEFHHMVLVVLLLVVLVNCALAALLIDLLSGALPVSP